MLTSKQRAQLRGMAASLDTIIIIGKGGINENLLIQVRDALKARELIKGRVLESSMLTAAEAAAARRGMPRRGGAVHRQQVRALQAQRDRPEDRARDEQEEKIAKGRDAWDDHCRFRRELQPAA